MSSITTLVTGATSGIGLEIARLLAERGHRLVLVSTSPVRLAQAAESIRQAHGVEVHIHAEDLSQPQAAQRLFDWTSRSGLRIDGLVNNAGFGLVDEHVALQPERLYRMLQLNIVAVAELCRLYGQQMKQRRSGRILNIASAAAYQPTPYFAAYGASKAFVLNFSEALAKELEDHGVSVSCLSPGPTDTAFFDTVPAQKIAGGHHFAKGSRADVRGVARSAVELMLAGGLSRVVGFGNAAMVFGNRFAPRAFVASVSKRLLRPTPSVHRT
jgi:short-subunit dehydrogenase